ncbi:MAG: PepSY domain-containing protein [Candidatus Heimdallarchaeota archaeon]|nr:PepSY domain-containing protein [Candidatus Heimdallarchaeota archaeon]MDH5645049.1 PepSY domain-containing protein [Candidatus Heimdallarchaeota archaeon]
MSCSYHPPIDAITKCQGCGRDICDNCSYDIKKNSSDLENEISQILCTPCNLIRINTNLINLEKGIKKYLDYIVIGIIFLSIAISLSIFFINGKKPQQGLVFIPFLVILSTTGLWSSYKKEINNTKEQSSNMRIVFNIWINEGAVLPEELKDI